MDMPCIYALTKTDVPYMPSDFPNSYPIGKDLDMYVMKRDYNDVIEYSREFAYEYSDRFNIKTILKGDNYRIRLETKNKLHYQIDITINDQYVKKSVVHPNGYGTLREEDEIEVRTKAYSQNNSKKYHMQWLEAHDAEI